MEFTIQKFLVDSPLIGLGLVFIAGIIGGLDTCALARIPLMFGVVSSTADSRKKSFIMSSLFIIGFILSYSILGAVLGLVGASAFHLIKINRYIFITLGIILFLCGIFIAKLLPFKIGSFHEKHKIFKNFKNLNYLGAFFFGITFAFFEMPTCPCCGPILLFLAGIAVTKKFTMAVLIFLTLALGQSMPLILISTSTSLLQFISPKISLMEEYFQLIGGNVLIIMAIYFWVIA